MALIVQKYGGSSVADVECMKRVAGRIKTTADAGNSVVVVVSAMGKTTDRLVQLAREVHADPSDREYDMLLSTGEQISISILAMALHDLGLKAVSMTGPQAGFITDDAHTKAKIMDMKPVRVQRMLDEGNIVIIAGFQGLSPSGDISTLGRGGSDLSAVAMAATLKADKCQIFTDVEGVYTTDPRVVPEAAKLDEVAYDEMLELASLGAKVLQARSVEFAKKYGVVIEVLSSFTDAPGTLVKEEVKNMEQLLVRGVAADKSQAKITVRDLPDQPGVAAELFAALAEANVNVDMIIQNMSAEGKTDLSFTVPSDDADKSKAAVNKVLGHIGGSEVIVDSEKAKISVVGVGMRSNSGVAHKMFQALADSGVNLHMISTSEIKISALIDMSKADLAVQCLHAAFELEKA